LLAFNAPEGIRYGILTTYAEGDHFRRRPSVQAAAELGRSIAQVHVLSDKMPAKLNRPENEASRQLEQYANTFALEFPDRKADIDNLHKAVDFIYSKVADLPTTSPYYGMIHGDVIRSNVLVARNNKITIVDFDLCGFGWRVYDVATFLLTLHGANSNAFKQAFLDGYNEVRQLDAFEQELIPLFKIKRAVVTIGIPVMNDHHWDRANIEPWYK
jgi:Ser/Thr protein kinase RdoA (MazF antagonist)